MQDRQSLEIQEAHKEAGALQQVVADTQQAGTKLQCERQQLQVNLSAEQAKVARAKQIQVLLTDHTACCCCLQYGAHL